MNKKPTSVSRDIDLININGEIGIEKINSMNQYYYPGMSPELEIVFDPQKVSGDDNGGNNDLVKVIATPKASFAMNGLDFKFDKGREYVAYANYENENISRFYIPGDPYGVIILKREEAVALFTFKVDKYL